MDKKKHPLYNTWGKMKSRCYNPKNVRFSNYGGRGITVCDRWLNEFWAFVHDMGDKPTPRHTLDRKENDGNYEPSNCRWALPDAQTLNQGLRRDNTTGHKGILFSKRYKKFRVCIGGRNNRVTVGSFDTLQQAIEAKAQYISSHTLTYAYH